MKDRALEFVCDFFNSRGKFTVEKQEDYILLDFVELKTLDSIEFITLISEIEEEFDIRFTQENIESELFHTIHGITTLIDESLKR